MNFEKKMGKELVYIQGGKSKNDIQQGLITYPNG